MNNIKLPILMYHEVLSDIEAEKTGHQMTQAYIVADDIFEKQIEGLVSKGYRSVFFDEVPRIDTDGKYVILTFDDGWFGNYKYVLPVLLTHGFKAIFFVATNLIGAAGYMNWKEVLELKYHGMSVQSHGVTHKPLSEMKEDAASWELSESKKIIEEKIGGEVTAISFPHGSYDKSVVKIAQEAGYTIMCTSEVKKTYNTCFDIHPTLLGRITITNVMGKNQLFKLIEFNKIEMLKRRIIKGSKNSIKSIIGIKNYRKLYRKYFNITG